MMDSNDMANIDHVLSIVESFPLWYAACVVSLPDRCEYACQAEHGKPTYLRCAESLYIVNEAITLSIITHLVQKLELLTDKDIRNCALSRLLS